jgi:hypothetical protein
MNATPNERLRDERVESRPKAVDFAPNFKDWTGLVFSMPELENDLNELIERIGDGRLLPARFYRRGIERDDDALLEEDGIKHLHLGGADSDVLLWLVEYDDRVVLLEINSHKHFETEPPGSLLRSLHDNFLRERDRQSAEARKAREEDRKRIVREGLLARKSGSSDPKLPSGGDDGPPGKA